MPHLAVRWKWAGAIAALGLIGIASYEYSRHFFPTPLRIGFEHNPPVQIRTPDGFSGLAVETVNEAAKRAGVQLRWVETGTSSDAAFQKGLVDLWPLMANLPERRKRVHITRPWLHSSHALLYRRGSPPPDEAFEGKIALFRMPVHVGLLRERFPRAQMVQTSDPGEVVKEVCLGTAAAGFLEGRVAVSALRDKPRECASVLLEAQNLPDLMLQHGVASTFESARAADAIRLKIGEMFRDGTLTGLITKYSSYGLNDSWASYDLMSSDERERWIAWAMCGLSTALALILWQAGVLRQRRQREALLRESEGRFRNLADTAPVMIWTSGLDKGCTFFNKGWLEFTGRTMEQELGAGWTSGVHSEDLDRCMGTYTSSFDARRSFQTEYRLRRADGEYRLLWDTGTPQFTPDGAFAGYVGCCNDITDVRRAQQEVFEKQKFESLGVLAGGIAHDFNNLLGSIIVETELAESDLAAASSPLESIQKIRAISIRAAEIIRELMIYAGHDKPNREKVDVTALVKEMLELLRFSLSQKAVLDADLGTSLPSVWGSATQLRQVVMNLVINASEALGDSDGMIRVTTSCVKVDGNVAHTAPEAGLNGDYVRLEVADSGCGMTEEAKARIFEPFYSTKFAGRGLGLAVVQSIIQAHNGLVDVQSAPGEGTRIQAFFPIEEETPGTMRGSSAAHAVGLPARLSE